VSPEVSRERQSARISEIKNAGYTCNALYTFECNYLTPLHFRGLTVMAFC